MSQLLNNGSTDAPRLQVFLNLGTIDGLSAQSQWRGGAGADCEEQLHGDGFDGVQLVTNDAPPPFWDLPYCGLDRINTPEEADFIVARHADRGDLCLTLHAGWGMEDDGTVDRLLHGILQASERHRLPVFLETHRATLTQDVWRTVEITKRIPGIRFNGDFSHYYCGQELVYSWNGNWLEKLDFMEPIFARTGFLHGRIASPGCMQVAINDPWGRPVTAHGEIDFLAHFREIWTRAMAGFLAAAKAGDVLIFSPELLSGRNYYARLFPDASGVLREESDRYAQALLYKDLAHACFAEAKRRLIPARFGDQPEATVATTG